METALCLLDKKSYDIASFSNLENNLLTKLRRALVCSECKGKGYYRKKSRDGKPACFGAFHNSKCSTKSKTSTLKVDPEVVEEVKSLTTNFDIIDVDFSLYTSNELKSLHNGKPNASLTGSSATALQYTQNSGRERNSQKGLRSLLRMLMHSNSFAGSDFKINTGWKYPRKAKNIFVNFDDINESLLEKNMMRGYWGVISHADTDISWLNTANEQDVSIPISQLKNYLVDIFGIDDSEDLAGSEILVFGWLDISKNGNEKWFIKVHNNNPAYIFIKPRK
jgi:hypothetical protein